MLDVKKLLTKITDALSKPIDWEYVDDVYWGNGTWTCPDNGFIEVCVEPNNANWQFHFSDSLAPDTGWSHRMSSGTNKTLSMVYAAKKGAVFKNSSILNVPTVHVWYYKFKKLGGVVKRLLNQLTPERGWATC